MASPARVLTVCVIGGYDDGGELATALAGYAEVVQVSTAAAALAYLDEHPDAALPLVVVNADAVEPVSTLAGLYADPRCADTRNVVLTSSSEHRNLAPAIDAGHLHALVKTPVSGGALPVFATSQLHQWLSAHGLATIPVADAPDLHPVTSRHLLDELESSEDELTERLVAAIDAAMERRPRVFLPPGVRLTRQGEPATGVYLILTGEVALSRSTPEETLVLHTTSTGRIVGLLSMAGDTSAFFTATTTTACEVIVLSIDQLDSALRRDPSVALGLAVSSIRGLAQRLRRSEELQEERNDLNRKLERERRRLARTLGALEDARVELISQAKFATLGELSAGVAHELNNPVAALSAAASHLSADVRTLLASHPRGSLLARVAEQAQHHAPISTAQERQIRRRIEKLTGSPEMAFRLMAAGVTDPEVAQQLSLADLELIEAAANLGTAARNIATASGRITHLVRSLKSYARPELEIVDDVDVHATIDDTLTLVSNRFRDIAVVRDYGAGVRPIRAHPSQLGQVWTNLLVNAADVLADGGRVTITTSMPDSEHVRVDIADDGPGIPASVIGRIFEPRFTTKHGTVRFGMGLGLGLSRSLVAGHGGTISVESSPGHTVFTVILPVAGPDPEPDAAPGTPAPPEASAAPTGTAASPAGRPADATRT